MPTAARAHRHAVSPCCLAGSDCPSGLCVRRCDNAHMCGSDSLHPNGICTSKMCSINAADGSSVCSVSSYDHDPSGGTSPWQSTCCLGVADFATGTSSPCSEVPLGTKWWTPTYTGLSPSDLSFSSAFCHTEGLVETCVPKPEQSTMTMLTLGNVHLTRGRATRDDTAGTANQGLNYIGSGGAIRVHLPPPLAPSLPPCLPASLPPCLPACLPASLPPCLPVCLPLSLPPSLPVFLPLSLPASPSLSFSLSLLEPR